MQYEEIHNIGQLIIKTYIFIRCNIESFCWTNSDDNNPIEKCDHNSKCSFTVPSEI